LTKTVSVSDNCTVRTVFALLLAGSLAGCAEPQATILVDVALADGPPPTALAVSVYDQHSARLLRQAVRAALPGTMVIVAGSVAGPLRIVVEGEGGAVSSLGGVRVSPLARTRVRAEVRLSTTTSDRDGDGVPDELDNCPDVANVDQADSQGGGIGDACPPDSLEDGGVADLAVPGDNDLATGGDLAVVPSCSTETGVLFCEDWEASATINSSTWNALVAAPDVAEINTDLRFVHRGAHSLHLQIASFAAGMSRGAQLGESATFPTVNNAPTFWVRTWFLVPAAPASGNDVRLFVTDNAASTKGMGVNVNATRLALQDYIGSSPESDSTTAPTFGSWSCFVWRIDVSATTTGSVSLTGVNIPAVAPIVSAVTEPPNNLTQLRVGPFLPSVASAQPTYDVYVDDILVDTKPLTCAE
jgi:thrombospondin type 3 repeat protein